MNKFCNVVLVYNPKTFSVLRVSKVENWCGIIIAWQKWKEVIAMDVDTHQWPAKFLIFVVYKGTIFHRTKQHMVAVQYLRELRVQALL